MKNGKVLIEVISQNAADAIIESDEDNGYNVILIQPDTAN